MPGIESDIWTLLTSDSSISALIGTRLYPNQIPPHDTPSPWVSYTMGDEEPDLRASSNHSAKCEIEFEIYAETYGLARTLKLAIRAKLNGYQGGHINRALWTGASTNEVEGGHLITERYTVRGTTPTVLPTPTSNARIVTGTGTIQMFPNGSGVAFTIDSDGVLYGDGSGLDGVEQSGTAAGLLAAHVADIDPHSQYIINNASELTTGTLADARLSVNVARRNAPNTITTGANDTDLTLQGHTAQTLPVEVIDLTPHSGSTAPFLRLRFANGFTGSPHNIDFQPGSFNGLMITTPTGVFRIGDGNPVFDCPLTNGGYSINGDPVISRSNGWGTATLNLGSSANITRVGVFATGCVWFNRTGTCMELLATSATSRVATFRGAASQTANLVEWQNNAQTLLMAVNSSGRIVTNSADSAPSNTTTPVVWINEVVNGVTYKRPLYQ